MTLSHLNLRGTRFPRTMLPHPAAERLLRFLGVQLVDDCDEDLEVAAREWLRTMPVIKDESPATTHVRRALERIDEERA